ncbi:MAG: hypothetical protein OEZ36_14135 [Spirochaetota bacterium]|nr:hypothetical protein [Spirochaetota bacterium]
MIYSERQLAFAESERKSFDSVYIKNSTLGPELGYEKLFKDWMGINAAGFWYFLWDGELIDSFHMKSFVSFYPFGDEHRFYVDLGGFMLRFGDNVGSLDFNSGFHAGGLFGLGYNYHPYNGGLYLKIGLEGIIFKSRQSPDKTTLGISFSPSLGYAF